MVSPSYKKGGFGAGFTEKMIAQCEQEAPAIPAPGRRMGGSHTVGDVTEKLEIAIQKLQKKAPDTPLSRLYDTDLNAISDALLRTEAEIRQEFSRRAGHLWATFSRKNHCRSHRTSALSQDRNTPFWRSLCLRFCPANEVHGTVPADRKRVILHCVSGWKWGAS